MARPRTREPQPGEDFTMSVGLDGEVAQAVLALAESEGTSTSVVLRNLVTRGLEVRGSRVNHSVLQRREAVREVRQQVLGEVRGAVARALNSDWSSTAAPTPPNPGRRRKR